MRASLGYIGRSYLKKIKNKTKQNNQKTGGEMDQQVAALLEDLGLIPSTHMVVTIVCNSSSKRPDALCWPLQALHTTVVHIPTGKTPIPRKLSINK